MIKSSSIKIREALYRPIREFCNRIGPKTDMNHRCDERLSLTLAV